MSKTLQTIRDDLKTVRGFISMNAKQPTMTAAIGYITTFIGDVELEERRGKTVGEPEVIAMVKKYAANAEQMAKAAESRGELASAVIYQDECNFWNAKLPLQMTDDEMTKDVKQIVASGAKTKGEIMQRMKAAFSGMYDGRRLAVIVDEVLGEAK